MRGWENDRSMTALMTLWRRILGRASLHPVGWGALQLLSVSVLLIVLGWATYELGAPLSQAGPATPIDAIVPGTPDTQFGRALPRAWAEPTTRPTATPTLTPSPTPTAVPPTVESTATPSPTLEPSPTPSPTVTPTPLHFPAESDPLRITAPSIGLDSRVVPVTLKEQYEDGIRVKVWEVADYAAGFHEGMARPGHEGNTVISGHNNIRGNVFKDIHKLKESDDIFVWAGDSPYRYRVSVQYRLPIKGAPPQVQQDNLRWILPTKDQRLTLITCWPPWSNTHRTVIVAYPAPFDRAPSGK